MKKSNELRDKVKTPDRPQHSDLAYAYRLVRAGKKEKLSARFIREVKLLVRKARRLNIL